MKIQSSVKTFEQQEYDNTDIEIDEKYLCWLYIFSIDDSHNEWQKCVTERKIVNIYDMNNLNNMNHIHDDNKVNNIAECNLLHDNLNP